MVEGDVARHKKGAQKSRATIVFLDESGFSERPSIRRTWAPRGRTPVLRLPFNWKRLSAIGALAATPAGRKSRAFLSLRPGAVTSEEVIEFLANLRRHVRGKVVLVWDGLGAHKSKRTKEYLAARRRWLRVEPLPPYAPELNPVECLWAYLGATTLANYSADGLEDLADAVQRGMRGLRRRHDQGRQFLRHSGLF
jgi:transposase